MGIFSRNYLEQTEHLEMLALSGDNGWEPRSRGKFATVFTSPYCLPLSFFTCTSLVKHLSGVSWYTRGSQQWEAELSRRLHAEARCSHKEKGMRDLRIELDSGAWQKWPHKGCHNASRTLLPHSAQGGQSLGGEGCCHSWGPRYGKLWGRFHGLLY